MSKKLSHSFFTFFIGFLVIIFSLLPIKFTLAADSASLTNSSGVLADFIYPATWNNLVMDFTLQHKSGDGGEADTLAALTLKNDGNARQSFEILTVKLWADIYDPGWQGWGYDRLLGEASFNNDTWYFPNLSVAIPASGLRLFVTINPVNSLATKKTVQFYIPQLIDNNGDGEFDLGDQGIFTVSQVNAPSSNFMSDKPQAINTNNYDIWAPEAVFSNLTSGQILSGNTSFTIQGEGRDQGRSQIAWVKIGIGSNVNNLAWSNVVNTGDFYSSWRYDWQGIKPGMYVLATQSRDEAGNLSRVSYPLTVTVTAPPPELENFSEGTLVRAKDSASVYLITGGKKCLVPNDAIFSSWGYQWSKVVDDSNNNLSRYPEGLALKFRDGYLIKGSGSKVYVISESKKRWITSGALFTGLGYQWNKINVISDSDLNSYSDGLDINNSYTHPMGTLIKYATYPQVFLLENGKRRHIANEATFLGLGYQWANIIIIPDWEYYPDGVEIAI